MNIKCFFTGHEPNDQTDCGYSFCERCGKHEYYDSPYNDETIKYKDTFLFTLPHILRFAWWRFTNFLRPVKKHRPEDDLPF